MAVINIPGLSSPAPIPQAMHSRSQLRHRHFVFENGNSCLYLSNDVYSYLFDLQLPHISRKSPVPWKLKQGNSSKHLWFPSGNLEGADYGEIEHWCEYWERPVVLGKSAPIAPHFTTELNFCMALSFNRETPTSLTRTLYGEAEYQMKYGGKDPSFFQTLLGGMTTAYRKLPIADPAENVLLTTIPSRSADDLPASLAAVVGANLGVKVMSSNLLVDKTQLKELSVDQKIPEWNRIYATEGALALSESVAGETVVVIDDLYQSGATMWCFARALKSWGAKAVIGLAAVKSLRDSDNQ